MANYNPVQETRMTDAQVSIGATLMAGGYVDQAALRQAEQAVAAEWKPGDVILDLYEVRKVTEGFGEDAIEKDYHEGGFGRVYKVWHRGWNMELAVKAPKPAAYNTPDKKEKFIRECETWINLGLHPNVAACYYVRNLGCVPRVFSEYATSGTLEDWITTGRLYEGSEKEALEHILDIAIQFAWGLHHSHEYAGGIIHSDVKPLNVLMLNHGTAKVSDFGLSKVRTLPDGEINAFHDKKSGKAIQASGCTLAYCSPEQLKGQQLTRRTDIWSWGLSVLAMFSGGATWAQPSFPTGHFAAEILETFLEHNNQDVRETDPEMESIPLMPIEVAELLRHCFQSNIDARPNTMADCVAPLLDVYRAETGNNYPREWPEATKLLADSLNNRGVASIELGNEAQAVQYWNQALGIDPTHAAAKINLVLNKWNRSELSIHDAQSEIAQLTVSTTLHPEVQTWLGYLDNCWHSDEQERSFLMQCSEKSARCPFRGVSIQGLVEVTLTNDNKSMSISNSHTSHVQGLLNGHIAPITCYSLSRDGGQVLSGGLDRVVFLWNTANLTQIGSYFDLESDPSYVVFANNCQHAVILTERGAVYLLGIHEGLHLSKVLLWPHPQRHGPQVFVDVDPDDDRFVAVSIAGHVHIWNIQTFQEIRCFSYSGFFRLHSKALSRQPSKTGLLRAVVKPRAPREEVEVECRLGALVQQARREIENARGPEAHRCLRLAQNLHGCSHDRSIISALGQLESVGGYREGIESVWESAKIRVNTSALETLGASHDGAITALGSAVDACITILSLNPLGILHQYNLSQVRTHRLAMDPFHRFVLSGNTCSTIMLVALNGYHWLGPNGATNMLGLCLETPGHVEGACVSNDGSKFAVAAGAELCIMDIHDEGNLLRLFSRYKTKIGYSPIRYLSFSPDGTSLLGGTGSEGFIGSAGDERLFLWTSTGNRTQWSRQHSLGWLVGAGWTTDGENVVTVTANGIVRRIRVQDGTEMDSFDTKAICNSFSMTSDTCFGCIGTFHGAQIWDLKQKKMIQTIYANRGNCVASYLLDRATRCLTAYETGELYLSEIDWTWSF